MLQLFRKKAESNALVGLAISDNHLSIARIRRDRGEPFLEQCQRIALSSEQPLKEVLPRQVSEMGLAGQPCVCVLAPRDYNLYLVEAPEVEPEEMRAAVRWKVKDLLDIPVEQAAIDIFPVPREAFRNRAPRLYTVVAQKTRVQQLIELAHRAELDLRAIDIPELAMRNLVDRFADDNNGLAFMRLTNSGSMMNLSRQGQLYLTRRINTQVGDEVMQSDEWERIRERLALEVQRSLDYYESQMGQNPVSRLMLAPRSDADELAASLDDAMAVQVSVLDFTGQLAYEETITPATMSAGSLAIGAALRNDLVALGG